MRIIYLPLENIEQRYSKMMNQELAKISDIILYPDFDFSEVIEKGQFLDINKTSIFKARQLEMVAQMFYNEEVKDGDVFLVADMFYPGIESVKYMSELQNINVKLCGFNYAGRADQNDFVQKLGSWSDFMEKGFHLLFDMIFVGSLYHKNQVVKYFGLEGFRNKIIVTGYIWNQDYCESLVPKKQSENKQPFVIWPHRICKEKGYADLIAYASSTDKKILVTSSGKEPDSLFIDFKNITFKFNLTKKEYYGLLAKAEFYLSTAYQETFGYTLQEALFYGCKIAVPNRACYPEMVPEENLFDSLEDIDLIFSKSRENIKPFSEWNNNRSHIESLITGIW